MDPIRNSLLAASARLRPIAASSPGLCSSAGVTQWPRTTLSASKSDPKLANKGLLCAFCSSARISGPTQLSGRTSLAPAHLGGDQEGREAADEEEDLTPEERRKLERKLKKERKKEEKKLMREAGISTKKAEPKKLSGSELALAYLTSWSENPKEWKFQKTRQTWLLSHMYEKEKFEHWQETLPFEGGHQLMQKAVQFT
ncbi:uncharacterized protein C7orf50 homolog isoform X2 [Lagopus muta]|uniref:uncharacterized protein C7orf50 homolog isoform X2 n=1 Tax=Lagopus muta TaxID=64668 RepID=UPI00209EED40|nr:uncharacterized protein C7orf50 homolog isoform X2 [Lagopus muta]